MPCQQCQIPLASREVNLCGPCQSGGPIPAEMRLSFLMQQGRAGHVDVLRDLRRQAFKVKRRKGVVVPFDGVYTVDRLYSGGSPS